MRQDSIRGAQEGAPPSSPLFSRGGARGSSLDGAAWCPCWGAAWPVRASRAPCRSAPSCGETHAGN